MAMTLPRGKKKKENAHVTIKINIKSTLFILENPSALCVIS